jgi:hypothetical protein
MPVFFPSQSRIPNPRCPPGGHLGFGAALVFERNAQPIIQVNLPIYSCVTVQNTKSKMSTWRPFWAALVFERNLPLVKPNPEKINVNLPIYSCVAVLNTKCPPGDHLGCWVALVFERNIPLVKFNPHKSQVNLPIFRCYSPEHEIQDVHLAAILDFGRCNRKEPSSSGFQPPKKSEQVFLSYSTKTNAQVQHYMP